jgi:hypothetical protein
LSGARRGREYGEGGHRAEPQSYYLLNEPSRTSPGVFFSASLSIALAPSQAARARVRRPRVGRAAVEQAHTTPPAAPGRETSLSGARAPGLFSPGGRARPHVPVRAERFSWRGDGAAELGSAFHRSQGGGRGNVPSSRIGRCNWGQARWLHE